MGQGKFTAMYTNDQKFRLFNRPTKQVEMLQQLLPRI